MVNTPDFPQRSETTPEQFLGSAQHPRKISLFGLFHRVETAGNSSAFG
jgi:hypothetical protein